MKKPPLRVAIGAMIFMTTFVNYMLRAFIPVVVMAMTLPHAKNWTPECIRDKGGSDTNKSSQPKEVPDFGPRYDWSEKEQANVIGSYFWGFQAFSLFAGQLAEFLGPWWAVTGTAILSAVFTSTIPFVAEFGAVYVMICRIFTGILGAVMYPALNVLIAKWSPPAEKGKFVSCMMGNTIGTVMTMPLVGFVTEASSWKWGIHMISIITIVFTVVYALLISNRPEDHRWITQEEIDFIKESQAGTVSNRKKAAVPPYLKICMSIPFWAMAIAQFGNLWALNLVMLSGPKFQKEALGFDVKKSAVFSAMPYLMRFFLSLMFGYVGDVLRKKQVISVTAVRKCAVVSSHMGCGIMFVLVMLLKCNALAVNIAFSLSLAFNASIVIGHFQNPQDLSPNFAGTLFGLISFVGGMTGFIVPFITGLYIEKTNGIKQWGYVYLTGAAVTISTGAVFILFASGEVQPWNEVKDDPPEEPAAT